MMLPTTPVKVTQVSPRKLFIFSHPKIGKTVTVSKLPNSLLIDLEDGSEFVEAMKINVRKYAKENNLNPLKVLKDISDELAKREVIYDYIILDTSSAMEDLAETLALHRYKSSPLGKNYTGSDVLSLPNGAGYHWLRLAFEEIYDMFSGHANKCLIVTGHVKNASINKDGKELNAKDIQLTGKLKLILTSGMDAIGFMYRNKETQQNILSFKTSEQDLATGARPEHLRGKEIVISEITDGNFVTYWSNVFID